MTDFEDIKNRSKNRKFDQYAHEKFDGNGKVAALELFQSLGYEGKLNANERVESGNCEEFWDVEFSKGNKSFKVDAEVRSKKSWSCGLHQIGFDTINIPARKFRDAYGSVDCLASFSFDRKGAYLFNKKKIIQAMENDEIDIEDRWAEGNLEPFVSVPKDRQKDLFEYYIIDNKGNWNKQ